jgi:hypothetical protein
MMIGLRKPLRRMILTASRPSMSGSPTSMMARSMRSPLAWLTADAAVSASRSPDELLMAGWRLGLPALPGLQRPAAHSPASPAAENHTPETAGFAAASIQHYAGEHRRPPLDHRV